MSIGEESIAHSLKLVIHQDKSIRALAYADTGATYSVFHSEYCEELGIDLNSGKRVDTVPPKVHFSSS